jgi:hypothetical protein
VADHQVDPVDLQRRQESLQVVRHFFEAMLRVRAATSLAMARQIGQQEVPARGFSAKCGKYGPPGLAAAPGAMQK